MKAAVLFIHGFTQPAGEGPGVGLYDHKSDMARLYPDRNDVKMESSTWDGHLVKLANDFADANPELIIVDAYSWGNYGMCVFCTQLAERGRAVDLAICVDPVPHIYPYWLNAVILAARPFDVPSNVDRVLAFRTLNSHGLTMPVGRDVSCGGATEVRRVVIGPFAPVNTFPPCVKYIPDGQVNHSTIDDFAPVRTMAVDAMRQMIDSLTRAEAA